MVGVHVRVLSRIMVAGLPHFAAGAAAISDDRGRYRIPGLAPGAYLVNVPSVQSAVPIGLTPLEIEGLTPDSAARNAGSDTPRRSNGAIDLDPGHLLIVGNYATPPPAAGRRIRWRFIPRLRRSRRPRRLSWRTATSETALTDVDPADLEDAAFLDSLVSSAITITIAEGERKKQDVRIGGAP